MVKSVTRDPSDLRNLRDAVASKIYDSQNNIVSGLNIETFCCCGMRYAAINSASQNIFITNG